MSYTGTWLVTSVPIWQQSGESRRKSSRIDAPDQGFLGNLSRNLALASRINTRILDFLETFS
jgi:hypothetical protein